MATKRGQMFELEMRAMWSLPFLDLYLGPVKRVMTIKGLLSLYAKGDLLRSNGRGNGALHIKDQATLYKGTKNKLIWPTVFFLLAARKTL